MELPESNCGNCRFAKHHENTYPKPEKPQPEKKKFLWWSYISEPNEYELWGYALQLDSWERYHGTITCRLNPKFVNKKKTSWCSHHQPKENSND